ncbi:MAG: GAF domain-containing protein [Clostridiales bacterium]|nr:GAF domain-containing protein [Clostridiales bacterium]
MSDYKILNEQLRQLTEGIPHLISNLANASALLFHALENVNWAGFYLVEGDGLVLGPFQGNIACIEIPLGRGVCGSAVAQGKTLLVDNVHNFDGHIACDSASLSEIVVPIRKGGRVVGVLDIDSPIEGRFTEHDRLGLEQFARIIEDIWI